jgi:hypothetical protein
MEAALDVGPAPAGALQVIPTPGPAPTAQALTAPGAAQDRVGLPEDYVHRLTPFYVFDRSDNRQVRAVYANAPAARVRSGQPFPYGSVLVMETWRAATTPDNQLALDAAGRYQREELTGIFVMRKEQGFGERYGPDRTGEWEYVAFRPDGSGFATPPERSQACAQCHLAVSDAQKDWVVRADLFFATPARLLGLPRTGHPGGALLGPGGGPGGPGASLLALAAGGLVLALGAAALGARARRRRTGGLPYP